MPINSRLRSYFSTEKYWIGSAEHVESAVFQQKNVPFRAFTKIADVTLGKSTLPACRPLTRVTIEQVDMMFNTLALAYLLLDRPMQRRFEADPLLQATLLLLQERIPKASVLHTHVAEHAEGAARTRHRHR